jgi:uncharacterized protein YlaN (UPF0358 family)
MANFDRSAKPSSEWTINELLAYNIRVVDVDANVFFKTPGELPPPSASDTILNNVDKPDGPLSKDDRQFFQYMKLVEMQGYSESRVADFAASILRMLNYDDGNQLIRQRAETCLQMYGKRVDSKIDVCVIDENDVEFLLVIHENKVSIQPDRQPIQSIQR